MSGYEIRLEARNQGLRYLEGARELHFDLARTGRTWVVQLPPTDARFERVHLSATDMEDLAPRIQQFLSRVWWFGVWPVAYEVVFRGDDADRCLVQRMGTQLLCAMRSLTVICRCSVRFRRPLTSH